LIVRQIQLLFNDHTSISRAESVTKRDPITNEKVPTNETINVYQIDHAFKLVEAETSLGATFGLGYVHATDRMWQMHFHRMVAQGRASEMFGSEVLPIDKYMRTAGIAEMAREHLKVISQSDLDNLEHYAAGVNKAARNTMI
jgi:acyl-homoserine lactone acylase PvdQ